jgi:hypothetical protein
MRLLREDMAVVAEVVYLQRQRRMWVGCATITTTTMAIKVVLLVVPHIIITVVEVAEQELLVVVLLLIVVVLVFSAFYQVSVVLHRREPRMALTIGEVVVAEMVHREELAVAVVVVVRRVQEPAVSIRVVRALVIHRPIVPGQAEQIPAGVVEVVLIISVALVVQGLW